MVLRVADQHVAVRVHRHVFRTVHLRSARIATVASVALLSFGIHYGARLSVLHSNERVSSAKQNVERAVLRLRHGARVAHRRIERVGIIGRQTFLPIARHGRHDAAREIDHARAAVADVRDVDALLVRRKARRHRDAEHRILRRTAVAAEARLARARDSRDAAVLQIEQAHAVVKRVADVDQLIARDLDVVHAFEDRTLRICAIADVLRACFLIRVVLRARDETQRAYFQLEHTVRLREFHAIEHALRVEIHAERLAHRLRFRCTHDDLDGGSSDV